MLDDVRQRRISCKSKRTVTLFTNLTMRIQIIVKPLLLDILLAAAQLTEHRLPD